MEVSANVLKLGQPGLTLSLGLEPGRPRGDKVLEI